MVTFLKYPKRHLKKLFHNGDYIEALEFGKSIESKFLEDSDFHFIMGSIYYTLEDGKKALPYFEKAIAMNAEDIETLMLKTNVHLSLNQKEEAVHCCKEIIKIDPRHLEAKKLLEDLEKI